MKSNFLFRVDASIHIGSGHVMRCLALAEELRSRGAKCIFATRSHPGNLIEFIGSAGFEFIVLPVINENQINNNLYSIDSGLSHESWLGADWRLDAEQIHDILVNMDFDWVVVDHYALDFRWEKKIREVCSSIIVIDDLADRKHECNILIDQNYLIGMKFRYQNLITSDCLALLGPRYALLRKEFEQCRHKSIKNKEKPKFDRLLVFMGGSDQHNEIIRVLSGVKISDKRWKEVSIVVGQNCPSLPNVKIIAPEIRNSKIYIQTRKIAELMAESDFAITSGGVITWEKCVMGLPSLAVCLAYNQRLIVESAEDIGVLRSLGIGPGLSPEHYSESINNISINDLVNMGLSAKKLCDGRGAERVANIIEEYSNDNLCQ